MENNEKLFEGVTHEVEEEDIPAFGLGKRIVSLFTAPTALMENIREKPVIKDPLLILLIILLPYSFVAKKFTQVTTDFMNNYVISKYGLDMAAMQAQTNMSATAGGPLSYVLSYIQYVLIILLGLCIGAALLLLLCKIAGGKAKFKQYFSLCAHVTVVSSIFGIIYMFLSGMFNTMLNFTSLAAILMPNGDITSIPFNILSYFSIGEIWALVLYFFGLKAINKFTATKTIVLVCIIAVVTLLFTAGSTYFSVFIMDLTLGSLVQ